MSEYYAVIRSGEDDHLEHLFGFGSKKGSQKKNHKYIARVQVGKGWRYFYDTAELAAYKAGKTVSGAANAAGKAVSGAAKAVGRAADNAYENVQLATNPKVREAYKKRYEATRNYNASRGVLSDITKADWNFPKNQRWDKMKLGSHVGQQYRLMKNAESEYAKARSDATPKAAVKRAISKVEKTIDRATGKTQKAEIKADAKKALVSLNRATVLERQMIKERDSKGYTKKFESLRRAKQTASDNYRNYRDKYKSSSGGISKFLNEVYDLDKQERARKKKK